MIRYGVDYGDPVKAQCKYCGGVILGYSEHAWWCHEDKDDAMTCRIPTLTGFSSIESALPKDGTITPRDAID